VRRQVLRLHSPCCGSAFSKQYEEQGQHAKCGRAINAREDQDILTLRMRTNFVNIF
jgi:uncharacterized protein YbbK (DUF523 family)